MQTNPAVEQNKTLNGPRVREISRVGNEKVYGGKDLVVVFLCFCQLTVVNCSKGRL